MHYQLGMLAYISKNNFNIDQPIEQMLPGILKILEQSVWLYIQSTRFGLVSLFNGISTLFRLFNAKAILLEEQ